MTAENELHQCLTDTEFFKVVVRFSRFMLLPELARFPAQDSDLLAL
jgi:hypothetical protein